jgi:guanylate kinase
MRSFSRSGILFVVSGPSGCGKSTLCSGVRKLCDLPSSVSCTTRAPRLGEQNGVDYWFLPEVEFRKKIEAGEFVEYALVHNHLYGTLKEPVRGAIAHGADLLLDIDVQGASQIRAAPELWIRKALVTILVIPPSFDELERRLRKRSTEAENQILVRLEAGRHEISHWSSFDYVIVSDRPTADLDRFRAIILAEQLRTTRLVSESLRISQGARC